MRLLSLIYILLFGVLQFVHCQTGITLTIENREVASNNLSWTFDLVATANSNYSAPNDNNWSGMSVRFDLAVGSSNITGGNTTINSTYALNGSIITSVPGTLPAGSSELGISATRNGQTDLPIGTPVTIGTYTINFSSPVDATNLVTPRTTTGTSGSFWSNPISGSRPFNLPAPFPLPITIKTFSATKDGERSSRLDWTSSSEINSDYIGIERSTDGEDWTTVGYVKAAGNSNRDIDYIYYDRSLPMARSIDNIFYYRLRLTDLDGQYDYSETRGVNMGRLEGLVSIYPNPATDIINVDLTDMDLHEGIIHLSVYDNTGKAIISKEVNGAGIEPIQASNMAAGSYQVVVKQGDTTHRKQIIVVN